MKTGFHMYFRLAWRTLFPPKASQARLTPKRFAVMAVFLPLLLIVESINGLGLLLDDVFFRRYRKVNVQTPVFIVGVPRSGTTFLHRLLAKDAERFTTFRLWELIFAPSITQRKFWTALGAVDGLFGRPLWRIVHLVQRLLLSDLDDIHPIALEDPEEDYLVLVPIFACYLLTLPFPFKDELWHLAYFDKETPERDRERVMRYYRACVQRHLYFHGVDKQFLSKNPAFSPMIESLRETFPDSKIVCNLRNPYYAVPSLLSSMMEGAELFDNATNGSEYRDQLMEMLQYWYGHLSTVLPECPESDHAFVTLDELSADPADMVRGLYERFGLEISETYETVLEQERERTRDYKSKHHYSLGQFELTPDDIYRRFSYLYPRFHFNPEYQG